MLKNASFDILREKGASLLLHSWAVAVIKEEESVRGVIFESKAGRRAVLAKVVIDTTGDGDIFALAGESFETDIFEESIHHQMNVAFLCGGLDMERYIDFRLAHPDEWKAVTKRAAEMCGQGVPHATSRNDVCLFMGPRLSGYSCLNVEDLTEVEVESRRRMVMLIDYYRKNLPGFENAWVMLSAPQMGVRHSRRLKGVAKMTYDDWVSGRKAEDEIGVSPPPNPEYPNVSIPFGCLVPNRIDSLLAAGRNLSCDARTHDFMREIPNCWVMGQAAGVAAAVAVNAFVRVRDVDIGEVRKQLRGQGVYLQD
jgi:hypothetical protein